MWNCVALKRVTVIADGSIGPLGPEIVTSFPSKLRAAIGSLKLI